MLFERLWVLWLAAPLVAALLLAAALKARRRRVVVHSLMPWEAARDNVRIGARPRRFPAILALQIAFVLSALTAAAGPVLTETGRGLQEMLVILDRTASMNAPAADGGTRMGAARDSASSELAMLPATSMATLRCVPPLDDGDVRLPAAQMASFVRNVEATDAPGGVWTAVSAASAERAVLAVTDSLRGMPQLAQGVKVVSVGSTVGNIGITFVNAADGDQGAVVPFVRVFNAKSSAAEFDIETRAGERIVSSRPAALDARVESGFTLDPVPAGVADSGIEIRLRGGDAFPCDDRAFLARGLAVKPAIAVVGAESPDLVRALEASGAEVSVTTPGGDPGAADIVVWVRRQPPRPLFADAVVVDPPGPFFGIEVQRRAGSPPDMDLSPWLFAECPGLPSVSFTSWTGVPDPPEGSHVACRAGGMAAVFEHKSAGFGLWFVGFPVDRGRSDWRNTPWFPIFWKAVVSRLGGDGGRRRFSWSRVGEPVALPGLPDSLVRVTGPRGFPVKLFAEARRHVFVPLEAGIYTVTERTGGPERKIAVNLADRDESDLSGSAGVAGSLASQDQASGKESTSTAPADVAAGLALAALLALLAVDIGWKRRSSAAAALSIAAMAAVFWGCGSSGKAKPEPAPLSPGQPLPPAAEQKANEPERTCPECSAQSGEGHKCGKSRLCGKCGLEASLSGDHICGLSRYCPVCGREAALAGHRCGRSRYCGPCKSEVPAVHRHQAD